MENGVGTVYQLISKLKQYQKEHTLTVFDSELGDSPVAFKVEKAEKNGQVFKWITVYPSEKTERTTVESVLAILEQCPKTMIIAMKDCNGQYSNLYTSLESMKSDFTSTQWVVISDRLSYEKYFAEKEPTNKDTAIDKLKIEIGKTPNTNARMILGWILKQTDNHLFTGILKSDRTMKGAITFASNKAKAQATNSQVAIVEDATVYAWIKEYFTSDKIEVPTPPKTKAKKSKKETPKKEQSKGGEEQVSLF